MLAWQHLQMSGGTSVCEEVRKGAWRQTAEAWYTLHVGEARRVRWAERVTGLGLSNPDGLQWIKHAVMAAGAAMMSPDSQSSAVST